MSRDCSGSLTDGHAKGGIAKWATCGSGQSAVCRVAADESVGPMVLRPLNGARTRILCLFIRPPEEILLHCIHSRAPFGIAGRLTGDSIAKMFCPRKGEMRVAATHGRFCVFHPSRKETPTAGKKASLTLRLELRTIQPPTNGKYVFIAASAMPRVWYTRRAPDPCGEAAATHITLQSEGGSVARSSGEALAEPFDNLGV